MHADLLLIVSFRTPLVANNRKKSELILLGFIKEEDLWTQVSNLQG